MKKGVKSCVRIAATSDYEHFDIRVVMRSTFHARSEIAQRRRELKRAIAEALAKLPGGRYGIDNIEVLR